jgi:broad specificity polyphosphatase/5'/3'-nucleotidase SurE
VWEFINKYDLLSEDYVLNVNFPKNIPPKGIKIGRLYCRSDNHYFIKNGDTYLAQRDFEDSKNLPPDADTRQILDGYISIVPISRLPFDPRFYEQIAKKVK